MSKQGFIIKVVQLVHLAIYESEKFVHRKWEKSLEKNVNERFSRTFNEEKYHVYKMEMLRIS